MTLTLTFIKSVDYSLQFCVLLHILMPTSKCLYVGFIILHCLLLLWTLLLSLIFTTLPFYDYSCFITDLIHFSLYLFILTVACHYFYSVLLLPISGPALVNLLSITCSGFLTSQYVAPAFFIALQDKFTCSAFPLTLLSVQTPSLKHPIPLLASWVHTSVHKM